MSARIRLGMLFSVIRPEEKMLLAEARRRTSVEVVALDSGELVLGAARELHLDVLLDREISVSRGLYALQLLGETGAFRVNDEEVTRICSDKLLTSTALREAGVPTPEVKVAFSRAAAVQAMEELGYPVVVKPVRGSWGRLMARVNDRDAAEAVLEHKGHLGPGQHEVIYVQKYVEKPGRDIRAYVVGDETICATYRVASHWLTNAARGGVAHNCPVTPELNDLCVRAADAVGGGALAVDLMETSEGYTVHEVNSRMEFKGSLGAVEVDIPGALMDYCLAPAGSSSAAVI